MKFDEAPDVTLMQCPFNHYTGHNRVISRSSFHLKGRGWAKDSYTNPLANDELKNVTGEDFRKKYREQLADPDHPRKSGDILKTIGRKNDNMSDLP